MGLRDRNPEERITANATIERVVVTARDNGDEDTSATAQTVYLTFAFNDLGGSPVTHERKFRLGFGAIPAPGSRVEITYRLGEPKSLDYSMHSSRPPDPEVPRGWSAGIFSVPDIGSHHAISPFARSGVDDQRELFRTGERARAEVLAVRGGGAACGRSGRCTSTR